MERGGREWAHVHDGDASCGGGEGGEDAELEDGEEEAVAEDELDGLPGDDEPHQQLHQTNHHRRFSSFGLCSITGAPSSPHQTLPSFLTDRDVAAAARGIAARRAGPDGSGVGGSRGKGRSEDGAESLSGVMERRGWMGERSGEEVARHFRRGGRGGGEEGSGVARRLRTSESKFHKKNIVGTAARATGTSPARRARGLPPPPPDLQFPTFSSVSDKCLSAIACDNLPTFSIDVAGHLI
jgi:hypothetical protein